MNLLCKEDIEKYLIEPCSGNAMAWKSPHVSFVLKHRNYDASNQNDTLIMDCTDTFPNHDSTTIHRPAFVFHLIDMLSKSDNIIVRLPLVALRYLSSMDDINVSRIIVLPNSNSIVIHANNTHAALTNVEYEASGISRLVDIRNDFILSSYDEEQQQFIDNYKSSNSPIDYSNIITIGGAMIKSGQNQIVANELTEQGKHCIVISRNQNVSKYYKLSDDRLNSGCNIIVFNSEDIRDEYLRCLNTPSILNIQASLSYNKTMTSNVMKMLLSREVISYVG